jgi:hypothetical protein
MQYKVRHTTPKVPNGGTNEWIYIHLEGPQGEFSHLIDNPGDDREQGNEDTYFIDGPEIAPIQRVGFRMVRDTNDGNYAWRCGLVEVTNLTTGYSAYISDFGWVQEFDKVVWKAVPER